MGCNTLLAFTFRVLLPLAPSCYSAQDVLFSSLLFLF